MILNREIPKEAMESLGIDGGNLRQWVQESTEGAPSLGNLSLIK
jgi:hypothetical protein